jgi:hypothetical protein
VHPETMHARRHLRRGEEQPASARARLAHRRRSWSARVHRTDRLRDGCHWGWAHIPGRRGDPSVSDPRRCSPAVDLHMGRSQHPRTGADRRAGTLSADELAHAIARLRVY